MRDTVAELHQRIADLREQLDCAHHDIHDLWRDNDALRGQIERAGALLAMGRIYEAKAALRWLPQRRRAS